MRALGRTLIRFIGLLLIISLVAGVIGLFLIRRSFPEIDGEIRLSGLDAQVEVIRDTNGIPHIYAQSTHDLFFAQGYVHAQDRFWQMDFWRHIGQGRLAELFGSSQVESDEFLRTLGFTRLSETEFDNIDDESQRILEAYSDGVNAYLADHKGTKLSFEYATLVLQNRGYEPEPWDPIDSISWARMMAWDLGANMGAEISRAILAGTLPRSRVDELFPAFPSDRPYILPESSPYAGGLPTAGQSASIPADVDIEALLGPAADKIALVDSLVGQSGAEIGSNNWVVAGSKTRTGLPILANDPHLSIQMPSIWYEIGLHCAGDDCPFNVAGFSFAGVPGVIIGHNDRIAWGVTNLAADTQDLYIERINPDNPDQYEVNGRWTDLDIRTETIEIAGTTPTEIEVKTTRHGPIISGIYGPLDDFGAEAGIEVPTNYAVALQWTALSPARLVEAVLGVDKAANWDEFRAAVGKWDIAGQNFVYADVDGNIGYQSSGLVPIRSRGDGRWPAPGWDGATEWTGFVPFDEMPSSFNPPEGFLHSANQHVVDGSFPHFLAYDLAYGYRGDRIVDVLATAQDIDIAFMAELQRDSRNLNAEAIMPALLDTPTDNPIVGDAQHLLSDWATAGEEAFQQRADLPGAALYASVWSNLLRLTFHDEMPERFWPDGGSRWSEVVIDLLAAPSNPWWDITSTSDLERRDEVLEMALAAAMDELTDRLGDDPSEWRWGDLHKATFRNATFGESGIAPLEWLFNRGPYSVDGGRSIVNATSWDAADGYEVVAVPSMRMIVDLSNFERSRTVHPTGQSGHIYHDHYIDMAEAWVANDLHPMHWDYSVIQSDAEGTLILKP
jgi:penicillin amidase